MAMEPEAEDQPAGKRERSPRRNPVPAPFVPPTWVTDMLTQFDAVFNAAPSGQYSIIKTNFDKRKTVLLARLLRPGCPDAGTFSPLILAIEWGEHSLVRKWAAELTKADFEHQNLSKDGPGAPVIPPPISATHSALSPHVVDGDRCPPVGDPTRSDYLSRMIKTIDELGKKGLTFNEYEGWSFLQEGLCPTSTTCRVRAIHCGSSISRKECVTQ